MADKEVDIQNKVQLFNDKKIRSVWNSEEEQWYFSVIDVIAVLTDSVNPYQQRAKISQKQQDKIARWEQDKITSKKKSPKLQFLQSGIYCYLSSSVPESPEKRIPDSFHDSSFL